MWAFTSISRLLPLVLLSALPVSVMGGDVLTSDGYSMCLDDPNIHVDRLNVTYDRNTRLIIFDVAGSSTVEMNVTVDLVILAYGQQVYTRTFNPCDVHDVNMPQICPVPPTSFSSQGQEVIPAEYAAQIPSIAFNIPDLDGLVQLTLKNSDQKSIACIQSSISNGHTFNMPIVSYAAGGVAAAALAFSAAGAVAGGGHAGGSGPSPSFGEVIGWFQGMATSGMLSVAYPKVYQSFTTNFAFSTGLVPWAGLQQTIDSFRKNTGGNLTDDSYEYLAKNATLMYNDGKMNTSISTRALNGLAHIVQRTEINVNGSQSISVGNSSDSASPNSTDANNSKSQHFVSGIQAYVEQLSIPQANTFMTVLLIWAIVVGAIIVSILLVKLILELCSMFGSLPKSLESWRTRYWWRLAKALTNLVLLLYGVWTLYCIYQFTNGDSWAAKLLAGVTLALFTAVLLGFSWKIYTKAHEYKALQGDSKGLYEDKEVWIKYSLFYESYKKGYWWLFVPAIVYMFARGCIIAGANGHGFVQAAGQLIVEGLMLILLLWTRPFERRSSQWINITIQTVRVLSIGCVLIFVEELGISQTTKTITGVILIVVQCVLTGILALLIAINTIIGCFKVNPHRKMRKEAEKARLGQDLENLTPLNPRHSLMLDSLQKEPDVSMYKAPVVTTASYSSSKRGRHNPAREPSPDSSMGTRPSRFEREDQRLITRAASMGRRDESASPSPPPTSRQREPRLPELDFGRAM